MTSNPFAPSRLLEMARRALQRGFLDLTASMGLVLALGFLQNLVLARVLGPEGLGHLAVVNRVMAFAGLLAAAGLTTSILRYCAAEPREDAAWAIFRKGVALAAGISLVVAVAVMLFPSTPAWIFDPVAALWLPLVAITLPLKTVSNCAIQYFQSRQRMRARAVINLSAKIVLVILMVSGALLDGFRGTIIGLVIGGTIGSGIAMAYALKVRPHTRAPLRIPGRELLRFGAWGLFGNFLHVVLVSADVMCVSALTENASMVGVYALAVTFQQIVRVPMHAYLDVRFPEMARVSSDVARLRSLRRRTRLQLIGIAVAAVVPVAALAPWFIPLAFGDPFRASALPLQILLVSHLFWALGAAQGRSMLAAGWVEGNFWAALFAAVLNIVLNLVLIPAMGIKGAALATVTTQVLWAVAVTLMCRWNERRLIRESTAT